MGVAEHLQDEHQEVVQEEERGREGHGGGKREQHQPTDEWRQEHGDEVDSTKVLAYQYKSANNDT